METLRYVHGETFKLGDKTKYHDKGSKSKKGYWEERGNLVVHGFSDYSNVQKSGCDKIDRYRILALSKLQSYGFHKTHCIEALDHLKGDVDESIKLLFSKYFPLPNDVEEEPPNDHHLLIAKPTEEEILEMREDEILVLQSIFENSFEVKENNKVWLIKLKLDYLLQYSPSEVKKIQLAQIEKQKQLTAATANRRKLEKCRNFAKGNCKYGLKCRYYHELEKNDTETALSSIDNNWFYVEIRFTNDCQYPYEPPMVFLKSTCPDLSDTLCLRLTRRLINESRQFAKDNMPCMFAIIDLIRMETDMLKFLENDRYRFLDSKCSLFYQSTSNDENNLIIENNLPTHYKKGRYRLFFLFLLSFVNCRPTI